MKKRIWQLLLFIIACILINLCITNNIRLYLHPRLNWLMYATIIILLSLIPFASFSTKINWKYGAFVFLILMFFYTPESGAATSVASENGVKMYNDELKIDELQVIKKSIAEFEASTERLLNEEKNQISDDNQELEFNNRPDISNDMFVDYMSSLQIDHYAHMGEEVAFTGLVYKQDDFDLNSMVVGRKLMYCCAADAQVVGLFSFSEIADQFEVGDWVYVVGKINETVYKDPYSNTEVILPYLIIESIEKTAPLKDPYVYY